MIISCSDDFRCLISKFIFGGALCSHRVFFSICDSFNESSDSFLGFQRCTSTETRPCNPEHENNPGCLGYIVDYTTQLCGDYNKPLSGSLLNLLNNQYFMERIRPFFFWWLNYSCTVLYMIVFRRYPPRKTNEYPLKTDAWKMFSWESKVPPPMPHPPRNKALLRETNGNSPLIRPYLLGGSFGGVPQIPMMFHFLLEMVPKVQVTKFVVTFSGVKNPRAKIKSPMDLRGPTPLIKRLLTTIIP